MEKTDKYEGIIQSILNPADAFVSAQEFMLVLMFLPYCAEHGKLVTAFMPLAMLAPIAFMPLVYSLLHRFDTLLFGRYHLVMPLSAFLSAPFFVLTFSARGAGASAACAIFFGLFFFVLFSLVYKYCAFSVRVRLYGGGVKSPSLAYMCFFTAGAAAAVACVFGFRHYDPSTAFVNSAYVISAVQVILAIAQYLTTFYGIPRLGGRRVQSVKSVFRLFYTGLNGRTYGSSLLFMSAFAIQLMLVAYLAVVRTSPVYGAIAAAAACAAFVIAAWVCRFKANARSVWLSVAQFLFISASGALCITALFVDAGEAVNAILPALAAALSGAGAAVAVRQTQLRFLTVGKRQTHGIVFLLVNITACAALAVGFVAVSAVAFTDFGVIPAACAFGASACLGIAALATAQRARVAAEYVPAPSYEYDAGDAAACAADATDIENTSILPDDDRDNT